MIKIIVNQIGLWFVVTIINGTNKWFVSRKQSQFLYKSIFTFKLVHIELPSSLTLIRNYLEHGQDAYLMNFNRFK